MRTYRGHVVEGRFVVKVEEGDECVDLDPRVEEMRLSPNGSFMWGYNGCEAAQLAYALVADATGSISRAKAICLVFKHHVIKQLAPRVGWSLTRDGVLLKVGTLEEHMKTRPPTDSSPSAPLVAPF